jgi:hypothetical protein
MNGDEQRSVDALRMLRAVVDEDRPQDVVRVDKHPMCCNAHALSAR